MTMGAWIKWVGMCSGREKTLRLFRIGYRRQHYATEYGRWISFVLSVGLTFHWRALFRWEHPHWEYRICILFLKLHLSWIAGGYHS